MKTKKKYYDVIVISFSSPNTDGRTLNFVNTLIKLNKSVCLIAQSGDNGNKSGDNDNKTGDNNNNSGDDDNNTRDNNNNSGDDDNNTRDNNNNSGDNSNKSGVNNNNTGDNGNKSGDNGNNVGVNNNNNYDFDLISIPNNPNSRVYTRWIRFTRVIDKIMEGIEAGLIIAEDVYSLPAAFRASRRQNTKLIYDSREIYSALGPLSGRKIKQSILTMIERRYVSGVSEFIISGRMDEMPLRKQFNTDKPFHLVMNLPPHREYIKSDLIRKRFSIDSDTIIVLYQGEILAGRGLDMSIEAIRGVKGTHLCIIGSGPYLSKLKSDVKRLNLGHKVHFTGSISYENLHKWTCSADIGLALFENVSKSYELALPNKLFEYCMALKPTICSDLPAMREVISEYNIGETFDMALGAEDLALRIREMAGSGRLRAFSEACRAASRRFSYESQEENILRITDMGV